MSFLKVVASSNVSFLACRHMHELLGTGTDTDTHRCRTFKHVWAKKVFGWHAGAPGYTEVPALTPPLTMNDPG